MSRQRFISLLIAALLVLGAALYASMQRNQTREAHDLSLLPLANELNTVTALSVRKGSAIPAVTVHKSGAEWSVAERADYPADIAKLRKLLQSLADAKIVEEKTSNPANFPIIGVEDPAQPGATGAEITVTTDHGKLAVIIGKPAGNGNFARRSGENKSYIIEPSISFETEPRFWIDSRLIDVPVKSIQSIEVKPATGAGYALHRMKPDAEGFSLDGTPPGRKPVDPTALAPSATILSGLNAEDVAAVSGIDFSKSTQAAITLSDGNVITVIGVPIADKHWIQVKASKDAALTAKAQGRALEVAGYRYDAIFRPLEQLLVPKESKIPAKSTAPAQKPALGTKAAPAKAP
jgi:hypothetical protein